MRLQCPQCGRESLVDDDRVGLIIVCPGCSARIRAPAASVMQAQDDADDDEESSGSDAPLVSGGGDDGKYQDLVDMTAMVDIVFFLLIFFMITTASGIISCIGMPPPKQEGAATSAAKRSADSDQDSELVTVKIDAQNRIFIDDIEFPTEADLHARLFSSRPQAKKLLVKAHGDAFNGTFVMVQDIAAVVGFEEFMLSVAKEEEPQ